MRVSLILPAAGRGQRFAAAQRASGSKIEFELAGKPAFLHTIEAFRAVGEVGQILLAVHPERLDEFRFRWEDRLDFADVQLIAGGTAERWETVSLALRHVETSATHIAVHDAARPAVSPALIRRVLAAAETHPAVIPGVAVSSTLKRVAVAGGVDESKDPLDELLGGGSGGTAGPGPAGGRVVRETVDRTDLVAVQTPQVFAADLLRRVYAEAAGFAGVTDDAGLVEAAGQEVTVVDGEPGNLKLTRPDDVELLEALLTHRATAGKRERAVRDLFDDEDD